MRPSALSQPPAALHHDEAFQDADAPRESIARLVLPHGDAAASAHTRPTMPVPSDYLFLAQFGVDEAPGVAAGELAERLQGLADEQLDTSERTQAEDSAVWPIEQATFTRRRTLLPGMRRTSAPPPPAPEGIVSIVTSMTRVPFLRRAPRTIARGSIDHAKACVLGLVDGRSSIEEILDTSSMPVPRVLRILNELLEAGVLGLSG